jgi:hypothetical protein
LRRYHAERKDKLIAAVVAGFFVIASVAFAVGTYLDTAEQRRVVRLSKAADIPYNTAASLLDSWSDVKDLTPEQQEQMAELVVRLYRQKHPE